MLNLAPNVISWLMLSIVTVGGMAAYVPQVVKLIKTKSAESISLLSWVTWISSYGLMVIYSVVFTADIALCLSYVAEMLCCVLVLILSLRYQSRNSKAHGSKV